MGQINPYRGIVVPSPPAQRVQPQKDRQGKRQSPQHQHEDQPQDDPSHDDQDGEPHLDVKA